MAQAFPRPTQPQREGIFEREERRMGRSDWTVADYYAEGLREFWRFPRPAKSGESYPGEAAHVAGVFVQLNCPPAKLAAHRLAERLAADAADPAQPGETRAAA